MAPPRDSQRSGRAAPAVKALRYVLPNLFTLGNFACGFLSVRFVMEDGFRHGHGAMMAAAVLILAGALLDTLDGLVARLTRTTSAMGVQLDSLADLVTAGIAPAFLVYALFLHDRGGTIAVVAPLLFAMAVALRLARFNVKSGTGDPRYFTGLPAPGGAGILAAFVICYFQLEHASQGVVLDTLRAVSPVVSAGMAIVTITVGLLMVSTIPYRSMKHVDLRGLAPRLLVILLVLSIMAVLAWPPLLFPFYAAYAASGPATLGYRWATRALRAKPKAAAPR